jgi:hypothetical protein
MKPIQNTPVPYLIIHPIGAKLRWTSTDHIFDNEVIIVRGYLPTPDGGGACSGCGDCDGKRYVDEQGRARCHYRKPNSSYGLRYWERIE